MDNITKKKKKRLSSIIFEEKNINSLIRFNAFTGNDKISSFYRKGSIL